MTTFEYRDALHEFGSVVRPGRVLVGGRAYDRTVYQLTKCAGCGRAGLAAIAADNSVVQGQLSDFYPISIETAQLPDRVPPDIGAEFREAELAAAMNVRRGASALFRSVLEKTLKVNGYTNGTLAAKIDAAGADGVLTAARVQRAHDEIRVLGNDVLHDDWREVTAEEVSLAHHYSQRILEDFYDDRATTETILQSKNRIPPPQG